MQDQNSGESVIQNDKERGLNESTKFENVKNNYENNKPTIGGEKNYESVTEGQEDLANEEQQSTSRLSDEEQQNTNVGGS